MRIFFFVKLKTEERETFSLAVTACLNYGIFKIFGTANTILIISLIINLH